MSSLFEKVEFCKLCRNAGTYRGYTGLERICSCESGDKLRFTPTQAGVKMSPEEIAYIVRGRAQAYAKRHGYPRTLRHLCALCSVAIACMMRKEGYRPTIVEGYFLTCEHVWIVHCGKIIDVTYTQFASSGARVYITPDGDRRYAGVLLHRSLRRKIKGVYLKDIADGVYELTGETVFQKSRATATEG